MVKIYKEKEACGASAASHVTQTNRVKRGRGRETEGDDEGGRK